MAILADQAAGPEYYGRTYGLLLVAGGLAAVAGHP